MRNKCFYCEKWGHLADDCNKNPNKDQECWNCGNDGHLKKDCLEVIDGQIGCHTCGERYCECSDSSESSGYSD